MTADDKRLLEVDGKRSRRGFSSSWSPVSRTTPQLLTPGDPFSNPIPFLLPAALNELLGLTAFMEEGGMYVCVSVCLSVTVRFFQDAHILCRSLSSLCCVGVRADLF